MIPFSSKFFYALGMVLAITAVVYGYTTGGGEVGPLSLGYKGPVGDILGYSLLAGGSITAFIVGFATTAFRDADPEVGAAMLGTETAPAPPAPTASYWPIVGAFGLGLVVVGVALNNVFFVAGLILLGAVAVEWTMQAWSERATGDPAVNRELRNRIMNPLEVPIAGFAAILLVILGFSRLFLAVSADTAVWAAIAVAALVFVVGTVLSTRPHLRTDLVAALLVVAAVATIGIGIASAIAGERDFEHHGDESGEEEHSEDEGADGESEEAPVEEGN